MQIFEITQKIPYETIDGELLDRDEIHLGFVTDEFFAQEFCNTHPDCRYGEIFPVKYVNHLKGRMVSGPEDLAVFRLPYKRIDEDY